MYACPSALLVSKVDNNNNNNVHILASVLKCSCGQTAGTSIVEFYIYSVIIAFRFVVTKLAIR